MAELKAATGADAALDQAIAEAFQAPPADYTESVERCRALVVSVLPGWHLHLGYGVSGILPYAELSNGDQRHVAEAPTVPLAVLRALVASRENDTV
ncbi:hypothetical protein [Azospirillum sp.]|uniref:hypothetical protein n=1 Tax=Azospirillum sp. TaxID=34012 RepID=UPI003D70F0A8